MLWCFSELPVGTILAVCESEYRKKDFFYLKLIYFIIKIKFYKFKGIQVATSFNILNGSDKSVHC